jgi:hypothetical protein
MRAQGEREWLLLAASTEGTRMSAIDPPLCKVCGYEHWIREGHKFGQTRVVVVLDFGKNTDTGKAPQGGKRPPGRINKIILDIKGKRKARKK